MSRYYFDVRCHEIVARDAVGLDLPDIAAARSMALETIRSLFARNPSAAAAGRLEVEIRAGSDDVCERIRFDDALSHMRSPRHDAVTHQVEVPV